MPKFSTMFDVAFTVEHDYDDPHDVPADVLIAAMQRRVDTLRSESLSSAREAFGECDTYAMTAGEHCPDESCPGVIDEDGECSHCGADYAELNKLPKDEYFV